MKISTATSALTAAAILFAPLGAHAADTHQTGKVVRIIDGDTLEILTRQDNGFETTRIRVASIDAPESRQDFGNVARQALATLCFNATAIFSAENKDKYGRVISSVRCGDADVATHMVSNGMAWVYRQYSKDPLLIKLETTARSEKRGLWQLPNPVAPWEFRRGQ